MGRLKRGRKIRMKNRIAKQAAAAYTRYRSRYIALHGYSSDAMDALVYAHSAAMNIGNSIAFKAAGKKIQGMVRGFRIKVPFKKTIEIKIGDRIEKLFGNFTVNYGEQKL